ncbi:MAG: hypothetical protein WCE46_02560 [Methanoregula sp.]|uniref:hypothetical protein n=1 Tax=Methanoregula sp. TaxID=2052170 RepID=UPI003C7380EE
MTVGYVPEGRQPFLPFGTRSGWELLVTLEQRHGIRVQASDLRPEKDIIMECLAFMESRGYAS